MSAKEIHRKYLPPFLALFLSFYFSCLSLLIKTRMALVLNYSCHACTRPIGEFGAFVIS